MHDDRGDIVLGWLTKVVVVLALLGVMAFDGISVASTNVSATDTAKQAAMIGSEMYRESRGNVQRAYDAALTYAEDHGGTIEPKEFEVARDGTVTVTFRKEASSVLLYRTKTTKKWTQIVATGTGRAV